MSVEVAEEVSCPPQLLLLRRTRDGRAAGGFAGFAMDQPLMVVPGRVIHLTGREAFVRAVEGDLMPELRRVAVTQRAAFSTTGSIATPMRLLAHHAAPRHPGHLAPFAGDRAGPLPPPGLSGRLWL